MQQEGRESLEGTLVGERRQQPKNELWPVLKLVDGDCFLIEALNCVGTFSGYSTNDLLEIPDLGAGIHNSQQGHCTAQSVNLNSSLHWLI